MPIEETPEERIGPYRLLSKLGQGGMGVVYRGVDDAGHEVAVKVLRPEIAEDSAFRRRLLREVETMRRIRSRYVAQVIDADLNGARPYIVTQYVAGHALDDTVRATGPLTGRLLVQVAAGLAEALIAIHAAGVVHRDLKPNNVMLVNGEPVVIDFGIAHAADSTRLTQAGMVIGTPGYLAPEVLDGGVPGPAVDIYAWAATVAFAATGRSPFGSGSLEAIVGRVVRGRADLTDVPPEIGGGLQVALARDPAERPTAAQLTGWLRNLQTGEPAPAVPPTVLGARTPTPPPMPRTAVGMPPLTPVPMSPVGPSPASPMTPYPVGADQIDLGWYKLVAYLLVFAATGVTAELPVLGGFVAVLAAWYLRSGDAAVRSRRVPVRGANDLLLGPLRWPGSMARSAVQTALSLLYAAVAGGLVMLVLLVLAESGAESVSDETVASFGLAAWAYVIMAGPGMMGPRRQLVRLLSATAQDRRTMTAVGLAAAAATFVVLLVAWLDVPHWVPLDDPYAAFDRLRDTIHEGIDELGSNGS
ncbi:protein kinase domain-containing protein [Actinomadura scrupuli]|uniref:serine/threonine-protein kinase n=1 Tax=Actinomadura scrupuli TaxID=559629 RepID=UPI003D980CC0